MMFSTSNENSLETPLKSASSILRTGNINLDGRCFKVIETASNGVVNENTLFYFHHTENCVTAEYFGGRVIQGGLIGYFDSTNHFQFKYVQLHDDRELKTGSSSCTVAYTTNDLIEMVEEFEWDQGKGKNVFLEVRNVAIENGNG